MKNNLALGVIMTLISTLSYAILTAIVKAQSAQIPTPFVVFIQSTITLILIIPFLLKDGTSGLKVKLTTKHVPTHFSSHFI